jgi:hypothetical protein
MSKIISRAYCNIHTTAAGLLLVLVSSLIYNNISSQDGACNLFAKLTIIGSVEKKQQKMHSTRKVGRSLCSRSCTDSEGLGNLILPQDRLIVPFASASSLYNNDVVMEDATMSVRIGKPSLRALPSAQLQCEDGAPLPLYRQVTLKHWNLRIPLAPTITYTITFTII